MKFTSVKAMVVRSVTVGLLAGAVVMASPAKAQAQENWRVGVSFGAPVYGNRFDEGQREAYLRHEQQEQQREAYLQHEQQEARERHVREERREAFLREQQGDRRDGRFRRDRDSYLR